MRRLWPPVTALPVLTLAGLTLAGLSLALGACSTEPPPRESADDTTIPVEVQQQAPPAPAATAGAIGTPMKERVATLGLLNKRNNLSQDLEMKPGEMRRIGDVIVRLDACERTAPWEMPRETGAFAQVWVRKARGAEGFDKIFSGWLFKQSPSLNVVEHPVYDVWVKDCAMRFPGEEADDPPAAENSPNA